MPRSPDYSDITDEDIPRPVVRGETITPVLTPNEARGGVTHHNVRIVLAVGLIAAIGALAITYFARF